MGLKFPKPRPALLERVAIQRQKRKAEYKLRASVRARDGNQCQCCHLPVFVNATNPVQRAEVHHIQYRSHGGASDKANMITVCKLCHCKIHAHEIEVVGTNALNVRFKRKVA